MDFLSARGQQGDAPTAWYGVDIEFVHVTKRFPGLRP
jgi:hypothetical protein